MANLTVKISITFNQETWEKIQKRKEKDIIKSQKTKHYKEFMGVNFSDAGYLRYLVYGAVKDE